MNSIPLISNVPGVNFSMNRGNASPEVQMRQEINTSLVALKKEAGTLEGLINEAAQMLVTINDRIATLENDTVKKSDIVDVVQSGNMNPVTSDAVNNFNFQGIKYGADYDCNTMGDGLALINEYTLNSPYKQGVTPYPLAYLLTRSILSKSNVYTMYRMQIAISYNYNNMFTRTYTDSGWSVWKKVVMDASLTVHTWRRYVNNGNKVYIHRDISTTGGTTPKWIKLILSFHGSFGDATRVSEYLVRLNYTPYSGTNYRGLTPVLVAGLNGTTTGYNALSNIGATLGWDASGIYIENPSPWANLIVDVISPYSET